MEMTKFELPKIIVLTEPKAVFNEEQVTDKIARHPSWGDCTC